MRHKTALLSLLLFLQTLWAAGAPTLRAYLSSSYLMRGETTELIIESSQKPTSPPQVPSSPDYRVRPSQAYATRNTQREVVYQYRYRLLSFTMGEQRIPPITVELSGTSEVTLPLTFTVGDPAELDFQTVQIGDNAVKYAAKIFLPERELYLSETVPAEIKVYLPYDARVLTVADRGLPEIERGGISVWRFHPDNTPNALPFLLPEGQYIALTYRSSAYPIRAGEVRLGPGHVRPVFSAPVARRGFNSWANVPVKLPLSQSTARAVNLPQPSPARFNGAVGNFSLQASVTNPVRSSPNDPVTVELTVSGAGNLDSLGVPKPDAPAGEWKLYPVTKKERAAERRYLSGEIVFTQIMRPTTEQGTVPAFELVYFDPSLGKYQTARSEPIPLIQKAAASPEQDSPEETQSPGTTKLPPQSETPANPEVQSPPPTPVPREAMSDFLGFVDPQRAQMPSRSFSLPSQWQLLPLALSLVLLFTILWRLTKKHLLKTPEQKEQHRQWKELTTLREARAFYKASSRYATRWIDSGDSYRQTLNEKRDKIAYRAQKTDQTLPEEEKKEVLSELKKRSTTILRTVLLLGLLSVVMGPRLEAATDSYPDAFTAEKDGELAQYVSQLTAQNEENGLPADLLYNLGVAFSKLERPGQAALYFHRALQKAPDHPEAQQNLRYLQRAYGSIVIERRGLKLVLSQIPHGLVKALFYGTLWLLAIVFLALFLVKKSQMRLTLKVILGGALFFLPLATLAFLFYPNDGRFCPSDTLAVVSADQTIVARTAASSSASEVIKTPPGSLCRVLDRRGLWAYLEFANGTRGWMNTRDLSMLTPESPILEPLPPLDEQEILN